MSFLHALVRFANQNRGERILERLKGDQMASLLDNTCQLRRSGKLRAELRDYLGEEGEESAHVFLCEDRLVAVL